MTQIPEDVQNTDSEEARDTAQDPVRKTPRPALYACAAAVFLAAGYFLLFRSPDETITTRALRFGSHTVQVPLLRRTKSQGPRRPCEAAMFVDQAENTVYSIALADEKTYTAEGFAETTPDFSRFAPPFPAAPCRK